MIRRQTVKIIKLKCFKDFRGTFVETFNLKKYKKKFNIIFKQDDLSSSKKMFCVVFMVTTKPGSCYRV